MKTTLVVMAAGMGSRFGGLKQAEPVTADGKGILDFSVYDAAAAGFDKAVFIVREDMEEDFKTLIGNRIAKKIDVEYVLQDKITCIAECKPLHGPRVKAIIEYAENDTICRSRQLLAYFGEKTSADCGACDVCLDEKTDDKDNDWEKALDMVKQTLNDKRRHKIQDLMQLDIPMELLAEIMTYMTNEELIACEDDEVYLLKAT